MSTRNTQLSLDSVHTDFAPHVTVASIVEKDGRFLLVEEYSSQGKAVINQPAGHLEASESLIDAAVRETLEETRWHIEITGVLNINLYRSPQNDVTYHRTTFIASALHEDPQLALDDGIIQPLWLTLAEVEQRQEQLRSPLVLQSIQQYLNEPHYPLAMVGDCR